MAKDVRFEVVIPDHVASRLLKVTRCELPELARRLLMDYFEDDRRTKIPIHQVSIRFPTDWWELILKTWGENNIGNKIRGILYPKINTDKTRPLTAPPEWKEKQTKKVSRKVKPLADETSVIKHVILPLDWFERLQEIHGENISTYLKVLIFSSLSGVPGFKRLTIPVRMRKYLDM